MKKFLSYLLTPIFLLVWFLLLSIFHLVQVVAYRGFGVKAHRRSVDLMNLLMIRALWILGVRCSARFCEALPTDRAIIFVANHQNKFDIPGLSWYLRCYAPKFVSKIELSRGIPSISYNLRHSGAALIDRSDARQALTEIGRLGALIESTHTAAVIFPEGTRSTTGELQEFATAGVKILLKRAPGAVVVPVYIHDTWKLNRYGRFPMSAGERVSWTVLPMIEPKGKLPDQVVALAQASIRREWLAQTAVA
ncbi:MAG: 1-acyl-sn-glycerol-3-phosphate acyltransferase [Nevskia sp.]|nr:1-acyl-sn-glycerol-3-phosphate acyltransferase [Nevskia sp.]